MIRILPKTLTLLAGLLVLVLATQVFAEDARAAGIGIYPSDIAINDAARGGEYFRTIGFWHSETRDQEFQMQVSGPLAQWVDFVDPETRTEVIDSVTVPEKDGSQSEGRAVVRIRIPADAANGEYPGKIVVGTSVKAEDSQSGSTTSVSVGAEIKLKAIVTGEQTVSGRLVDVSTKDVEEGAPVRIQAAVQNGGNVSVIPQFEVAITSGPDVIGEGTLTAGAVPPGETATLEPAFSTEGLDEGSYRIELSVKYQDHEFGNASLQFDVVPVGTYTRQGVLDVIELAGPAQLGAVSKLNVVFRNTGEIDSKAVFVGEVQRDGVLVETLQSPEKLVEPGASERLDVFVETSQPGDYVVTGKINFEGKETETKSFEFTVSESASSDSGSPSDTNNSSETGSSSDSGQASADSSVDGESETGSLQDPSEGLSGSSAGGSNNGMLVAGLVLVACLSVLGAAGWLVKRRRALT